MARTNDRAARELLDLSVLDTQTGGDETLRIEVLHLFISGTEETLAALPAMADREALAAVHRLTGSARAVGAAELAAITAAVERGGAVTRDDLAAIGEAYRRVRRRIDEIVEKADN